MNCRSLDPIESRLAWLAGLVGLLCSIIAATGCATEPTLKGGLEPFAPAGVTAKAARGKRYALLVGVDQFEDDAFNDLRYAGADARAMSKALSGFDAVITLTGEKKTGRADILAALSKLQKKVKSKRDVIFVYFSTHGTLAQKPGGALERFLVAEDTRLDMVAQTGIAVNDIIDALAASTSTRTALVLATCHSGTGKSQVTDELSEALASQKSGSLTPLSRVSEASIVLSASAFEEAAREEPKLGHDVYTYFFLKGLKNGDRDGDGAVTVSEAHDWARQRTYAFTNGSQRPMAWSSILGQDPIVLAGKRNAKGHPVVFSYQRSADGLEVTVDGQTKGALPGGVVLEPGRHRIGLRDQYDGRVVWEGDVELEPGQRIEASQLIPPPRSWGFRVDGGVFSPLAAGTRQDYFPAAWGVGLHASLLHEPWQSGVIELRGSMLGGASAVDAFDTSLAYDLLGGHVEVGLGKMWTPFEALRLSAGADLGVLWASRTFRASQFEGSESMRGITAGGFGELGWQPFERFEAALRVDLGLMRAPLGGDLGPHPWARISLGLGTNLF